MFGESDRRISDETIAETMRTILELFPLVLFSCLVNGELDFSSVMRYVMICFSSARGSMLFVHNYGRRAVTERRTSEILLET